jgi:hypothetical protein
MKTVLYSSWMARAWFVFLCLGSLWLGCGAPGTTTTQKRCPDGSFRPNTEPCPDGAASQGSEVPVKRSPKGWQRVGCGLHSCAPPQYCNEQTGFCELRPCDERGGCEYGYQCDLSRNVCQ